MELVLASKSPRRIEILKRFGLHFTVCAADIPEITGGQPEDTAVTNAAAKAAVVFEKFPNALVIGADTIVVINDQILGKPQTPQQATTMLRLLSGKMHQVITGVAIISANAQKKFSVCTDVCFRELADYEIQAYINTKEPFDKAGAYAIQGIGGAFVESISGCYYNVVGLPIPRLLVELRGFGIDAFARGESKEEQCEI